MIFFILAKKLDNKVACSWCSLSWEQLCEKTVNEKRAEVQWRKVLSHLKPPACYFHSPFFRLILFFMLLPTKQHPQQANSTRSLKSNGGLITVEVREMLPGLYQVFGWLGLSLGTSSLLHPGGGVGAGGFWGGCKVHCGGGGGIFTMYETWGWSKF